VATGRDAKGGKVKDPANKIAALLDDASFTGY
jgi:hypothetical protein